VRENGAGRRRPTALHVRGGPPRGRRQPPPVPGCRANRWWEVTSAEGPRPRTGFPGPARSSAHAPAHARHPWHCPCWAEMKVPGSLWKRGLVSLCGAQAALPPCLPCHATLAAAHATREQRRACGQHRPPQQSGRTFWVKLDFCCTFPGCCMLRASSSCFRLAVDD